MKGDEGLPGCGGIVLGYGHSVVMQFTTQGDLEMWEEEAIT